MAAIVLAIINLVIIILRAFLSGSVDRAELVKKVQEAQESIDKVAQSKLEQMREENREFDAGLESMQDQMDGDLESRENK